MSGSGTGTYTGPSGVGTRLTGSGAGTGTQIPPVAPAEIAADDIFGAALRDIFASPVGDDATYYPASGSAVSCRVIINRNVLMQPSGLDAQVWERGTTIEVTLSSIGNVEPKRGETIVVGAETFTIQSIDQNDGLAVTMVVT